jgi:hypothetical protein
VQLRKAASSTALSSLAIARQQAAELADGERLAVDSPETIADKYHAAIATITPEQIEAAHVEAKVAESGSGGSIVTTRNTMHRDALAELLDAERAGHVDDDQDAGDR